MTNDTTKTLTAADATREAIRRLIEDGMTTVTAKDVQPVAEALSPAVKDGYASFYLAAFAREGRVQRVSRGTYDVTQIGIETATAPSVEDDEEHVSIVDASHFNDMTKAEVVAWAKENGIQLKNVKNTKRDALVEQVINA